MLQDILTSSSGAPCGRSVMVAHGNAPLRRQLCELVRREAQAEPLEAESAEDALALLGQQGVNAILLDQDLPGAGQGGPLCGRMRAGQVQAPILVLGSSAEPEAAIAALDGGATDYVTMPQNPPVLLARLRAHMRQHEESDFVVYRVGPYEFRPGERTLRCRETGRRIRLTGVETRILRALLRGRGAYLERNDLMQALWQRCDPRSNHAMDSHIYRIRQKIEPDPREPSLLVTEGAGYRLRI